MSGRGKRGKGLGAGAKKARVEPYEWTVEEEVVMVTVFNQDDHEASSYTVPWSKLPLELGIAMTQLRQSAPNKLAMLLVVSGDIDENECLFERLGKSDLGYERDDGEEEEHDNGDEELDEDDKQSVMDNLEEWVTTKLDFWSKPPTAAVRICGAINIVEAN